MRKKTAGNQADGVEGVGGKGVETLLLMAKPDGILSGADGGADTQLGTNGVRATCRWITLLFPAASTSSSSTAEMMLKVEVSRVSPPHLFLSLLSNLVARVTVETLTTCLLLSVRHENYN